MEKNIYVIFSGNTEMQNQVDFAKSNLTEMRNQSKICNYPLDLFHLSIIIKNSIFEPRNLILALKNDFVRF